MDTTLSEAVSQAYASFGRNSADQIVCDDDLLEEFIQNLPKVLQSQPRKTIRWSLLSLRKRGKLPRRKERKPDNQ
jgi:hypothetical protein